MRIIVTGDRFWACNVLAVDILQRLVARYGPDLVIVHGGGTGVDQSFADACKGLVIVTEVHPVAGEEDGVAATRRRNQAMVDAGADLCIALHHALGASKGTKDCARRAVAAGIPSYLVYSETGRPSRLAEGDERLA